VVLPVPTGKKGAYAKLLGSCFLVNPRTGFPGFVFSFSISETLYLLLRASNSLQYREGHEVFSVVTGGRLLSFSRLISAGSSSPEPVEGNAEGEKNPLLISRRKDQAGSLGTEEKTS